MNTNKRLLWLAFACVVFIGGVHLFGTTFYLYWNNFWFDGLAHFLGGAVIGLLFIWLWYVSGAFEQSKPTKREVMIAAVLMAMIVGIGWEFFEYVYGIANPVGGNYPVDTFHDLLFDFIGGVVAGFVGQNKSFYE